VCACVRRPYLCVEAAGRLEEQGQVGLHLAPVRVGPVLGLALQGGDLVLEGMVPPGSSAHTHTHTHKQTKTNRHTHLLISIFVCSRDTSSLILTVIFHPQYMISQIIKLQDKVLTPSWNVLGSKPDVQDL